MTKADSELWQRISSDFAKLADEEKGTSKHPLSVMATQEANHPTDLATWSIHNSHSENFTARFELLASQAGKALGPLPSGAAPFQYWLHRLYQHLREERSRHTHCQVYTSRNDTGDQISVECPLIEIACEASSTFCLRLQKRALEYDRERRELSTCFQDWIENNFVNVSVPPQVSGRNRVSIVAESASTSIPIHFLSSRLQEISLQRGSTEFGSPRKFLDQVAAAHGLIWAITPDGLWMSRQPPIAGEYIDATGMQHSDARVQKATPLPPSGPFLWSEIHSLAKDKLERLDKTIRAEISAAVTPLPASGGARHQFFVLLEEHANEWANRAKNAYFDCLTEIGREPSLSIRLSIWDNGLRFFLGENLRQFLILACGISKQELDWAQTGSAGVRGTPQVSRVIFTLHQISSLGQRVSTAHPGRRSDNDAQRVPRRWKAFGTACDHAGWHCPARRSIQ